MQNKKLPKGALGFNSFSRFMNRVIAPGALVYGERTIDVSRIDEVQPVLLTALDNTFNDWLRWLEAEPRGAEDRQAAMAAFIRVERRKDNEG